MVRNAALAVKGGSERWGGGWRGPAAGAGCHSSRGHSRRQRARARYAQRSRPIADPVTRKGKASGAEASRWEKGNERGRRGNVCKTPQRIGGREGRAGEVVGGGGGGGREGVTLLAGNGEGLERRRGCKWRARAGGGKEVSSGGLEGEA
ncbi:hypothetical protein HNY73_022841 [Argiope bruennichi]|uniref:Uncharacterized protein n=1 Tax=Argiope bruennichi TaxID=94029 RepID=A0A8T0E3N6_ARGBR|nr:hypothetical protein HNY73_022841 [Argiope bruennichi]